MEVVDSEASVHFPSTNPHKLAARLREARIASKDFPEFEGYHTKLMQKYKFRVTKTGVMAEYQESPVGEVSIRGEVIQKKTSVFARQVIPDVQDSLELFGAAIRFSEAEEINFPNVVLTLGDRKKILAWATEKGWKYIDHAEAGATLTKKPVPEEVLWRDDAT
jgi:hypothetical protein